MCLVVGDLQHEGNDPRGDRRRDLEIFSSIALGSGAKVLILRVNPDGVKDAEVTCRTTQKARHGRLLEVINTVEPPACARYFLYYTKHKQDDEPPANHWAPAVRELSKAR